MSRNSIKKLRWGGRVLLVLYLACLIYFMFFSESYGRTEVHTEYRYNLVLFQEIRRFLRHRDILGLPAVLINIVGNVGQEPYHGIITFNKTKYEIADAFVQNNLKIEYISVTAGESNLLMSVKVPLYSVIRLESDSYYECDTGNV